MMWTPMYSDLVRKYERSDEYCANEGKRDVGGDTAKITFSQMSQVFTISGSVIGCAILFALIEKKWRDRRRRKGKEDECVSGQLAPTTDAEMLQTLMAQMKHLLELQKDQSAGRSSLSSGI